LGRAPPPPHPQTPNPQSPKNDLMFIIHK